MGDTITIKREVTIPVSDLVNHPDRYHMFSAAAERRVRSGMEAVAKQIARAATASRREAIAMVRKKMDDIAKRFGEVTDTEPHWAICDALEPVFRLKGWEPYNRFND